MGALPAAGFVNDDIDELYDYDVLRRLSRPTAIVVHVARPTLVLGSSQGIDILAPDVRETWPLRRRRGGGGVVLLQPDDLWIDWWIPADDPRWTPDTRLAAIAAGRWWCDALTDAGVEGMEVHEGGVEGDPAWRAVCFAGLGPGEVTLGGRKVVGVTQWRVREGTFLSTVLHARASDVLVSVLADAPQGLAEAVGHVVVSDLDLDDPEAVVGTLSSPPQWERRVLLLDS